MAGAGDSGGDGGFRFAPQDCPVCGGDGLGWACDGCGKDGGPCPLCQDLGAPGGCFGCARDSDTSPYLAVDDQMIVGEQPLGYAGFDSRVKPMSL